MKTYEWALERGFFVARTADLPFPLDRIDARFLVGFPPKEWQEQLDRLMHDRETFAAASAKD